MPDLRVGVLGALEVHVDGHRREVAPGRQRAVLACLVVHAGRPVSPEALIEAAWRDHLPQDPRKALRTVLSRLRTVVGQDAIAMGPGGYRLTTATTDAEEFTELVERARSVEPERARESLGAALALWRGPAFGEHADAGFATALAQQLEQLRMDAIEAHAATLIEVDEPAAAVPGLRELLAEQPFREHAVELLVTALYHAGRQAEALELLARHRAALGAELGLEPSPSLVGLQAQILGHELAAPRRSTGPPHWLDTSTAFIGREDEVTDLVSAVLANQVTVVTGPGGVGKSRLVAQVLPAVHGRLGRPTAVIELATIRPGGAARALAASLGLRGETASGTEALVEFLTAVPHLLVLDNCEHLLDELGPLLTTIARRCRDVRVLATSRRRLGVGTERLLPLEPLQLPDPAATAGGQGSAASMRLFGDRVRRLRPGFALTPDNTREVAELCRRCDGLPLALELAASRTATCGVTDVLELLPTTLTGQEPGSLGAVVAWSYRLLAPEQRHLLEVLSVLAGDFSTEAVRGLAGHLPSWHGDATTALAELVESSLVAHHDSGGDARFRLLEMVRVFAADRLERSGGGAEARAAHAAWVHDTVTAIRADWPRADGATTSARLSALSQEIVQALGWALGDGRPALAGDIAHAVVRCLHWTPGLELRDLIIDVGERAAAAPGPEVAGAVAAAAFSIGERGDPARARELGAAALAMSQDPDSTATGQMSLAVAAMYAGDLTESARWFEALAADPSLTGEANTSLALICCYRDDLVAAREHAEIALAAGASGSDASHAFARYAAGEVEARTDPSRGAILLSEASAEADRVGAEQVGRVSRVALFALLVRGGRHEEAVALGLRVLTDLRRLGAWTQVWTMLRMLAELLAETGRWSDAAFFLGAAQGSASAPPPVGQDIERYAEVQVTLSQHLGARALEQIQDLAAATPRSQVLSRAERCLTDEMDRPARTRSGVGKD